ncbi:AAA family ATPase [Bacillus sp. S34]|nr:AAA family ATPase [Bacillus sp. S34]
MGRKTYSIANRKKLIQTYNEQSNFNEEIPAESFSEENFSHTQIEDNIKENSYNGEVIAITSAKGGVGKSLISSHIGYNLAMMGKKVCVMDVNFDNRGLDIFLGNSRYGVWDLSNVLEGECTWRKALVNVKENLSVVPGPHPSNSNGRGKAVNEKKLQEVIAEIKSEFEYIIMDSPSLSETHFEMVIKNVDRAIVILTPFINSIRSTDVLIRYFNYMKMEVPSLIVNKDLTDRHQLSPLDLFKIEEIESLLGEVTVLDAIQDEKEILLTELTGQLLEYCNTSSKNSLAFYNICRKIIGEEVLIPEKTTKKKKSLFTFRN